ncbi:MAG: cytochrome c3 family protein [Sideroxydans sp.]|nr:cytochrome c3 family protein [Sideroxydans sp.]
MSRILKFILAANLLVLAVLVFVYPNLMVGPGKLIPGHKQLETDCFACHSKFGGAESARCVTCHKPAEIGRLTTAGAPVIKPLTSSPFHQQLVSQDCVACHSDHAGVKRYRQPGLFDHNLLNTTTRTQCQSCHKSPADSLHQKISGNCSQCHSLQKWTPATFDHGKSFTLDRDHNASCATCHPRNDYSRYTCYGCHEHSLANIRGEHIEEGIRNFDNCVECHRSANEHDIRWRGEGGREGRSEHGEHGDDD